MTQSIAGIEDSIKKFFENRIYFSSSLKQLALLTNELAGSIQAQQQENNFNVLSPNIFNITIGKSMHIDSEILYEWLRFAYPYVEEKVSENSLQLNGPLKINLKWVDDLDKEFKIDVGFSTSQSGNTIPLHSIQKEQSEKKPFGHLDFVEGEYYDLIENTTTIGRGETNSIVLDNLLISRFHAKIIKEGSMSKIIDNSSTTGTFVNGNKIKSHILNSGDVIRFGDLNAIFSFEEDKANDRNFTTKKLDI